jgi:hypothetical protein
MCGNCSVFWPSFLKCDPLLVLSFFSQGVAFQEIRPKKEPCVWACVALLRPPSVQAWAVEHTVLSLGWIRRTVIPFQYFVVDSRGGTFLRTRQQQTPWDITPPGPNADLGGGGEHSTSRSPARCADNSYIHVAVLW